MRKIIYCFLISLLLIEFAGCGRSVRDSTDPVLSTIQDPDMILDSTNLIPVETFYSDYFPCSDCHSEIVPNPRRRELVEMHDDILFEHDSENRWCLACHYSMDRDSLVLAGGRLLGFNESYKLCGQCHGPKLRDWKLGIHGKRTGEWNGQKQYLLCVSCHDPHSPKFKSVEPLPPPREPKKILIDTTHEKTEENSTSP